MGRNYIGHNYVGHNYIGHNCALSGEDTDEYRAEPRGRIGSLRRMPTAQWRRQNSRRTMRRVGRSEPDFARGLNLWVTLPRRRRPFGRFASPLIGRGFEIMK